MDASSQHQFKKTGLKHAAMTGWMWNFLVQITGLFFTTLVFLITSRLLDPTSFGIVAFAAAVVALVASVMPVAFGEALVQREELHSRHLNSVFWLCLGFAGTAYGLLLLAAPFIAAHQETKLLVPIISLLGTKLFCDAISTVPNAILTRRMEFRALAMRSVLANAGGASLCLTLIWLGYPLWGLAMSQVISPLVSMAIVLWVTRWWPSGGPERAALRDLSHFGLTTLGGQIIHQAKIDQLLFGLILGPAALGLYFFARRLDTMLTDLTAGAFNAVSGVIFATLQSDPERRKRAFTTASFASTTLGFPVFGGLIVVAPVAIPLVFGPQWGEAVIIVQSLSVIGLMASLGIIQGALIRYLGAASWWFRYQLLMQAMGWGLIVLLAPFGASTVVIAFAVRTVLFWPISVRKTAGLLDLRFGEYLKSFAAPAFATLTMVLVVMLLMFLPQTNAWVRLGLQIGLGAAAYVLALALLARRQIDEARAVWSKRKEGHS